MKKILIVDDIERNRLILDRFLSSQQYEIINASSGKEALDIVERQSIDLVLMDIKMPDMDGFEATKKIKALQTNSYLPIIFVTALPEEEALEEALQSGGDDFITKPVSFDILLSKIKAHARIRELNLEVNRQKTELTKHNIRLRREHELIAHFFDQAQKNCFVDERIIKSVSLPMSVFNGDTVLVARRPNGGVTVLVGDFTGHGLSAAVGTLPVSQIFFQMVEENAFVGDIARELNRQINILLPIEMFFAASIFELSAKGDRLMVWHGGMPDAHLYDMETAEITTVKSEHLPLGVREDNEFNEAVQLFYVNANSKFIVWTDGLSEAENIQKQMIDSELLVEGIRENQGDILSSVINKCQQYSQGMPQADDISLIELSCLPVEADNHEEIKIDTSSTVPWQIKMILEDQSLDKDAVDTIVNLIGDAVALKEHKGVIHTLLNEMYTNTIDHGLLDLHGHEKNSETAFDDYYQERRKRLGSIQGAKVEIDVSYRPVVDGAELTIIMAHNGNSFDPAASEAKDDDFHGRGMDLIEAICESVEYSDKGRCLAVVYKI